MELDSKYVTYNGKTFRVVVEKGPGDWLTLRADGDIKAQSANHDFIWDKFRNY
jgi:hypothetical protein